MMTEADLVKKIQELKQIKPRKDWAILTKKKILGEEPSLREQFSMILEVFPRIFLQPKPVFATLVILIALIGTFGLAQNSLPGDTLYPLKKITERGQAVFVSEEEKPAFQLEQVNKRLEDLNNIIETNQVRNLASGLEELNSAKIEVEREVSNLKNKPSEEAIKVAKKVAPKLIEVNKKEKQVLAQLFIEPEKVDESAVKTIATLLIEDLKTRTLTENQQELFEEAKEDYEAGNYSSALVKILFLSD